jgi:hypothetical protein
MTGRTGFVGVVDHINKGDSGGADEFFTPEMEHKFRTAIEKYLGGYPDLIQWLKWEVCTRARDATKV